MVIEILIILYDADLQFKNCTGPVYSKSYSLEDDHYHSAGRPANERQFKLQHRAGGLCRLFFNWLIFTVSARIVQWYFIYVQWYLSSFSDDCLRSIILHMRSVMFVYVNDTSPTFRFSDVCLRSILLHLRSVMFVYVQL